MYRDRERCKVEFEILVKYFNDIVSENRAKRNQIDILRKERTLYDGIFKDLEGQIKKEEESLLKILEKSRSSEVALKENSEYLKSMNGVLERSKSGSIRDLMAEHKVLYDNLTKSKDPMRITESAAVKRPSDGKTGRCAATSFSSRSC